MPHDASPVDAVRRFAAALHEIRCELLADLNPISDVADLMSAVRSRRELPREGFTSSGIQYSVHGVGCRMIAADGRQVDIDLVTDPVHGHRVEAFDPWRIRWFLDEAARDGYSEEDLTAACIGLAEEGRLREVVAGRWFALPDARERPHLAPDTRETAERLWDDLLDGVAQPHEAPQPAETGRRKAVKDE